MKINESPALTRVLKVNATSEEQIEFLNEQISELKQQKICYDGMIRLRQKAIKQIEKNTTIQNFMTKKALMRGLLGHVDDLKLKKKRRARFKSKKKSKKKTKKKKIRSRKAT